MAKNENYDVIDVPMAEWRRVQYTHGTPKEVLFSDEAGPCHLIGIINTRAKIAYLGHFLCNTSSAEDLINLAVREAEDVNDLRIALCGNEYIIDASESSIGIEDKVEFNSQVRKQEEYLRGLIDQLKINRKSVRMDLGKENANRKYTHEMEVDPTKKGIRMKKTAVG